MKAYTDLEQSKKLAKILPLESADMYYACGATTPDVMTGCKQDYRCYTMCWSLAALLDVMKEPEIIRNSNGTWLIRVWYKAFPYSRGGYKNPVDACVAMIEILHELKML